MVGIRDASYIFLPILLVKGNVIAYFLFVEKIGPIKRVCPFNMTVPLYGTLCESKPTFGQVSPSTVHRSFSGLIQMHRLTAHSSLHLIIDSAHNVLRNHSNTQNLMIQYEKQHGPKCL